jgi:hypothetical protein
MHRIVKLLLLGMWLGGGLIRAWSQEAAPTLPQILRDWQARQRLAQVVECQVQGTQTITADRYGPQDPKEDITFPLKARWLLDFSQGRLRKELDMHHNWLIGEQKGEILPFYEIRVYDGREFAVAWPREKNPLPTTLKGKDQVEIMYGSKDREVTFWFLDYPIFLGLGHICSAGKNCWPVPGKLAIPLKQEDWILIGHQRWKERDCWIVRSRATSRGQYEYWIDVAWQSAVVRCLDRVQGKIWRELDIDYQATQWGWLPAGWRYIAYSFQKDRMDELTEVQVVKWMPHPKVTDADFQIALERGRVIEKYEGKHRKASLYRVGPEGKLAPYTAEVPSVWKRYGWLIWAGGLLLSLGGTIWWLRYRARRQI